jgi:hypothetical protein
MLNGLRREGKLGRIAAATLAALATAGATQLVSVPPAGAQTATCNSYQFIPQQLYTGDYEDQWWYNDGSGDEITLSYPGATFMSNGLVNGSRRYPPATTFVRQTGLAFSVNLSERDSNSWDNDDLGTLTVPAANTFGSYWFSGNKDTSFSYFLSYEVRDQGRVSCPPSEQPVPTTNVPFVVGLYADIAAQEVRDAGLVPKFTGAIGDPNAWVDSVSPVQGKEVAVGSTVTMHLAGDGTSPQ